MRRRTAGATLIDILVASFVLGLLTTMLFALFRTGIVGLKKVENQSELLRELQLLSLKISRELQESSFRSLSVSPDGHTVAFLSADDANDNFQMDEFGRPLWQKFILYHFDATESVVRRTEVPYLSPEPGSPQTLEVYTGDELIDHVNSGTPVLVAKHVEECQWRAEPPSLLEFGFRVEKRRYQGTDNELKRLTSQVQLRN